MSQCQSVKCDFAPLINKTNFTCDQLNRYCASYSKSKLMVDRIVLILNYNVAVTCSIGFFAYVCMLLTLRKMQLTKSTSIYHQFMVVLELLHMIIGASAGVLQVIPPIPNSYLGVFWTVQTVYGWIIADWLKLAVSTMVAFVTMERCVAVWWPTKFNKLDHVAIPIFAIILSLWVGAPHLCGLFFRKVAWNNATNQYGTVYTPFYTDPWFPLSNQLTYFSKLVLSLIILIFSLTVVLGLRARSRKVQDFSTKSKDEWKNTYRLCILSLIVGTSTLGDHLGWVIYKYTADSLIVKIGTEAVSKLTYETAIYHLWYNEMLSWMKVANAIMGTGVHPGRFFIYVSLSRSFRDGFRKAFRFSKKSNESVSTVSIKQ